MANESDLKKKIRELRDVAQSVRDESALDTLIYTLKKARRKASDEYDPFDDSGEDENLEDQGFHEVDPDAEQDDAAKWLKDNDPEQEDEQSEEDGDRGNEDYEQPSGELEEPTEEDQDEVEETPPAKKMPSAPAQMQQPMSAVPPGKQEGAPAQEGQEVEENSRFRQPTREEIADMRSYTRPWEQKVRDAIRLRAEAHKNPVLHREGNLIEARNMSHKDRDAAYNEFTNADDYKNADPITQMEMDDKFNKDWHEKNPEYLKNAIKAHSDARSKTKEVVPEGQGAMSALSPHRSAKLNQLMHIMQGGAQSDNGMSMEEAMQHAGGEKSEDGTTGSIVQDKASSFAHGNKDFLNKLQERAAKHGSSGKFDQHIKDLKSGGKAEDEDTAFDRKHKSLIRDLLEAREHKPGNLEDADYATHRENISHILGDHPALKDPAKKRKSDEFFAHYYPLINMSAKRVLNKLGIDPKNSEINPESLHESGFHGLLQAINDYDHSNPGKASFATHAGNKIRGLMQTAIRSQDAVPAQMRRGAKELITGSKHPKAPDMHDRMTRTMSERAAQGVTPPTTPKKPTPGGET